ncbi:ceramide glucosyltransferase [Croceibacterium mercuriale]|uniref:Ceramide glucosyltransferase n=1 Tax=Croceibacterium mercuriale TaxID=1572751 RepID=A0A0B2C290_9SPHN|nr:CHAD domain-containing protein [Croceibacterium mercuriale]KHL26387.1 ceramide glucosyltransferase [Croceibacterium mercuriale]
MQEVELKLDLTAAAADALEASDILPGKAKVRRLHAIYFDTPKHALARAGLSLRIRAAGKERIQTVKADGAGSAGLFLRSEWEMPVDGDIPVLDDSTPVKALLGDRIKAVAAQFEVAVERRIWLLQHDGAGIEVVLDRGTVRAGGLEAPICEIELELKTGEPAALFALARALDSAAPIRLGVLTKAERGHHLSQRARSVFKAEPVVLTREMTAAQAFQHVAQTCLRQFRRNEAVLFGERNPEALHQARVALRRLRSAFSIFRPLHAGDESAHALREELRWLSGELGRARDRDVLLERAPAGKLRTRIRKARDEAYASVEATLASPRVRALMLDLSEWLVIGAWQGAADNRAGEPALDFATAALDRFRRRVKKGGRDLEAVDDETRHEVRKDAKKLRYASEFFAALFDGKKQRRRHKRFVGALEDLQDQLGALNDLATAPEVIRELGLEGQAGTDALLAGGRRKSLIADAVEAHDALADAKRFWR